MFGSYLAMLLWKVVKTLGGEDLLEEVDHEGADPETE